MSNQAADFDSAEEYDDFVVASTKYFQSNPRKRLVDQLADTITAPRQQKQTKINREQATISPHSDQHRGSQAKTRRQTERTLFRAQDI